MKNILPYRSITPTIGESVFIAPNAVVIGDTHIGDQSAVWFNCVVRGDVHEIRIGARTNIQDGTVVHVTHEQFGTYIGDDITIGHMCLIHACTIESGAFIGMGSTILDGCVVEGRAMLAAGSLLTPGKRVPAGELWAGRPAKFMRKLSEEDYAQFKWNAQHYVDLAKDYL